MKFDKVQDYSCVDKTELVELESFNKQFCFVFKQPFVKQFLLLVVVGGQIKTISAWRSNEARIYKSSSAAIANAKKLGIDLVIHLEGKTISQIEGLVESFGQCITPDESLGVSYA
ncbi:hypothetical protein HB762_26610 (plasmid) [Vibrio campbellii]|uniref:Uncharacterized protein n=1 Tax=Vibrio campbellii TaxID=680 RepID=A0ABY5IKP5_9VIBR|nr:hypothetical protein [Vibrio campbellii]UTZ34835.1 hypothetical protein HB762_26610 [Vibrio campbellii]